MKPVRTFVAIPNLPAPLQPMRELAYNLRWAWNHATIGLFRRLDSELWEESGHNPALMLGAIDQSLLDAAANDEGLMSHLEGVSRHLKSYMSGEEGTWFKRTHKTTANPLLAYFSLEFGVTECLSIFAGGLAVLAGDLLKSASDLGVPAVGIGLLYQQGYFRQYLNDSGWQQEIYEDNDFHNLPVTLECSPDGKPLLVEVNFPERSVFARIWRAQVGRTALYLLDTNINENQPADRDITDQLYGGTKETRFQQEYLLGFGGYRALEILGITPRVFHMNEGHTAFLTLARIRALMEANDLSIGEACQAASAGLVFTTHTPVPAGHDYFEPYLIDRYLGWLMAEIGLSRRDFLALGRQNPDNDGESFCMTVLALKLSSYSNAVSKLHGQVSREMWKGLWPGVPVDEIPITHITNGVHFRSWISQEMDQLYDRYLGSRWREEPGDQNAWRRVESIPAEELWRTHERRRERLVAYARRRLVKQIERRGGSLNELQEAEVVLDPKALTIGFARRFATYKRATLLFRDPPRLAAILNHPERPVQLIFAGKAHPQDTPGKELIRQVAEFASRPEFRRRVVFLEDYDMAVSRYLVQGADVWLNNPVRFQEASGTSGMKAVANGAIHVSTLDGWWDEAYRPEVGWAIGRGETYDDPEEQANLEAEALYSLLERDIAPTFYQRTSDGLPRGWITKMKASIQTLSPFFNTHRMVAEYTECFYMPADRQVEELERDEMARAKALAAWQDYLRKNWGGIRILDVSASDKEVPIGAEIPVQARVDLGALQPEDVVVQLYIGKVDADGDFTQAKSVNMQANRAGRDRCYTYTAQPPHCCKSGLHGYTVRILPNHPDLKNPFIPGLITWA